MSIRLTARRTLAAAGIVALALTGAACSDTDTAPATSAAQGAGAENTGTDNADTEDTTVDPITDCDTPAFIAGTGVAVYPTEPSDSDYPTYAHIDTTPSDSDYKGCTTGLSYAVIGGTNGTLEQPAGTGSSLFQTLAVFVDGEFTDEVRTYEFHSVTVESASESEIVAVVDTRHNGVHPEEAHTVTIRLDDGDLEIDPDLDEAFEGRLWVDFEAGPAA